MNDANYRSLQKSSTAKVCIHALMHPDTTSAAEFCELCSMEQFANVRHWTLSQRDRNWIIENALFQATSKITRHVAFLWFCRHHRLQVSKFTYSFILTIAMSKNIDQFVFLLHVNYKFWIWYVTVCFQCCPYYTNSLKHVVRHYFACFMNRSALFCMFYDFLQSIRKSKLLETTNSDVQNSIFKIVFYFKNTK